MAKFRSLPTPSAMIEHLNRFVYGQQRAKRDLTTAVYRHYLNLAHREKSPEGYEPFGRQHVLLLGPSGAGKTLMVRTLAKLLGVPVAFGDATSLVESGYSGEHLNGVLRKLYIETRGDLDAAHRGFVYLDEIDKIRRQDVHTRDIAGEGVQSSLLAPLDGCPVEIELGNRVCSIDTSRLLFICTGAFVDLPDIIRRRLSAGRTLGFRPVGEDATELTDDQALARGELQDLRAYGMIKEFLGRFGVISTVQSLSRDDLVSLLKNAEDSALRRAVNWYHAHDIDLVVPDESLALLADQAIANGTLARGLDRALSKLLAPYDWQLPEMADGCYRQIILTPEAVSGQAEPHIKTASAVIGHTSLAANLRDHAGAMLHAPRRQADIAPKPEPSPGCAWPADVLDGEQNTRRQSIVHRRRRSRPVVDNQLLLPFDKPHEDEQRSTNDV